MGYMKQNQSVVNLPKEDVRHLLEAMVNFEKAQDKIEDYLMMKNSSLRKKIFQARKEHLAGKTKRFRI